MNPLDSIQIISSIANALSREVEFHSAKAKEMTAEVANCRQIEKRLISLIEQRREAIQRKWNARKELRASSCAVSRLIKSGAIQKLARKPSAASDPNTLENTIYGYSSKIDRAAFSPGIYFLFYEKKIVYVGQSVNVLSRIASHKEKMFDRFTFFPCRVDELNDLERAFINVFLPELNVDQTTINLKADRQQ